MHFGRVLNKTGSAKMGNYLSVHASHEMQEDINECDFSSLEYKMMRKKKSLKSDWCSLIMFHTRAFQIMLNIFIGSRYDKVGLPGSKVGRREEEVRTKKIISSYFLHRHMDNAIQTTDKMHQKIC